MIWQQWFPSDPLPVPVAFLPPCVLQHAMLCVKNIKYNSRPACSDWQRRRATHTSTPMQASSPQEQQAPLMLEAPAGLVADVPIKAKTGDDGVPVATCGTTSAAGNRKTHRSPSRFSARGLIAETLPKVASYLTIMITWLIFRFLLRGLNKVDEADVHLIVMTRPAQSWSLSVALVHARQPGQAGCKCVRLRRHLLSIVGAVKMMYGTVLRSTTRASYE